MHGSLPNTIGHVKITDRTTRRSIMAERPANSPSRRKNRGLKSGGKISKKYLTDQST